jgi:hypothetical protein
MSSLSLVGVTLFADAVQGGESGLRYSPQGWGEGRDSSPFPCLSGAGWAEAWKATWCVYLLLLLMAPALLGWDIIYRRAKSVLFGRLLGYAVVARPSAVVVDRILVFLNGTGR